MNNARVTWLAYASTRDIGSNRINGTADGNAGPCVIIRVVEAGDDCSFKATVAGAASWNAEPVTVGGTWDTWRRGV